jgi:hypothetical protein
MVPTETTIKQRESTTEPNSMEITEAVEQSIEQIEESGESGEIQNPSEEENTDEIDNKIVAAVEQYVEDLVASDATLPTTVEELLDQIPAIQQYLGYDAEAAAVEEDSTETNVDASEDAMRISMVVDTDPEKQEKEKSDSANACKTCCPKKVKAKASSQGKLEIAEQSRKAERKTEKKTEA